MNDDRHLRTPVIGMVIFTLIILILATLLKGAPSIYQNGIKVRIEMGELDWSLFFDEPYEKVIFIFTDQTWIGFHTYNEYQINLHPPYFIEAIERECGKDVKDIATIIHNHPTPRRFTPGDNRVYNYFLDAGFRGAFMIYYPFSKRTIKK